MPTYTQLPFRRAAVLVARAALRLRSRPFALNDVAGALVVAPHPDDEAFGCGGAIALMASRGARVHVAFVTDGGASHPGHPAVTPAALSAMREGEARSATRLLGLGNGDLTFLRVPDGTLAALNAGGARDVTTAICALLRRLRPDAVFVTCRRDGSTEHDAAFAIAWRAVEESGVPTRVLEYPVWSWWSPALLLRQLFRHGRVWRVDFRAARDAKARALQEYRSQTQPIPPDSRAMLPDGFIPMFLAGGEYLFENRANP